MRTVTASEARQSLAEVLEASRREPVVIQRQKRDVAVVMSMASSAMAGDCLDITGTYR